MEKVTAFMSNVPIISDEGISSIVNISRFASVPSSCNLAFLHNEAGGDAEPIMSVSLQRFNVCYVSHHVKTLMNFLSCNIQTSIPGSGLPGSEGL